MVRLSIHLFTILTKIIQMSLKYKKIFSEFFGVGVGVPKKILSESESESESRKFFFPESESESESKKSTPQFTTYKT
jgi:hypothetical protein